MTLAWLDEFLPLMRCPNSKEALRPATTAECTAVGLASDAQALANQSGTLVYPIIDNMPHLLPTSALNCVR
jgi:uncharacterized protein YbaR (Trm112 family)